jgi:hypothetical protein
MDTNNNNTALIDATVKDLRTMVEKSVNFQTLISPVYEKIVTSILDIFGADGELTTMEAKDLMKLLDITSKAQIQPVVELTKLVQSVTALCERSVLQEKISSLESIVKSLVGKDAQNKAEFFEMDGEVVPPDTTDSEDGSDTEDEVVVPEVTTDTNIDSILENANYTAVES